MILNFSKLRPLQKCLHRLKLHKYFSIKQNLIPEKNQNKLKKTAIEENKILYSTVLELEKINLRFQKRNVYFNNSYESDKKKKFIEFDKNPIPISVKLVHGLNNELSSNDDDKNELCADGNDDKEERLEDHNISIFKKYSEQEYPKNWMHDYEFYAGDDEQHSINGTPDPSIPPSRTPCCGCGANLQCADVGLPGYIPSEIFKGRTKTELQRIICQRCHFLKNYNIALNVNVTPEMYINVLKVIKDKFSLVVLIIDLLDFPCSIWPDIQDLLGNKRPIFVVGNKVDLLPKDSKNYLDHIKKCLTEAVVKSGLSKLNIKNVCLISAKTGYGVEELITQLHKIWSYKGDVYLVGCTNVGKSSLFNALLRSDYCKVQAKELVQRATTCIWPGTTLKMLKFPILRPSDIRVYERFQRLFSERAQKQAEDKLRKLQLIRTNRTEHATLIGHIGSTFKSIEDMSDPFGVSRGVNPILTLDEKHKDFINSKWCYDTPGVVHSDQIHHLLTTEELIEVIPRGMVIPRVFRFKPQISLFLAGLARFDLITSSIDALRITIYSSLALPALITKLEDANEIYEKLLGSELLSVPRGDEDRLKKFPKLEPEIIEITGEHNDRATCDIILSSIGWIGLNIPRDVVCKFQVWTPEKRGIHVRKPSLIPFGEKLRGKKIRASLAYKLGKPFIKQ